MNRLLQSCLFIFTVSLLLVGCESKQDAEPPPVPAEMQTVLLHAPIDPVAYELPSQALATWRDFASYRPTLVLLATHPLLDPIPVGRLGKVTRLIQEGTSEEIIGHAQTYTSEPLILPTETLSAAIGNDLFSEVVLVLPTHEGGPALDLNQTTTRLTTAGFISEAEAKEFQQEGNILTGRIRGKPVLIAHPESLPAISRPVILHIDYGFFQEMYADEVKTPIYDLLHQQLARLKAANYLTLAATLSYSNQEIGYPLEGRFLLRDLADILRRPQLLDGKLPDSWNLRAEAMYLKAMYTEAEANELTERSVEAAPDDAGAQFALAVIQLNRGMAEQGFTTLDRAISLDRGYALYYVELAERALKANRDDKAIECLSKASLALPDNPVIRVQLARLLLKTGRSQEAIPLIEELQKLTWSDEFYRHIPALLVEMKLEVPPE